MFTRLGRLTPLGVLARRRLVNPSAAPHTSPSIIMSTAATTTTADTTALPPPPPPRAVVRRKPINFDDNAALRVVKGSFLGIAVVATGFCFHAPPKNLRNVQQALRQAALYVVPFFGVREYVVTPILHRQWWNSHRGVSRYQDTKPSLWYNVPDTIVTMDALVWYALQKNIYGSKAQIPIAIVRYVLVGAVVMLGNGARIVSWNWAHQSPPPMDALKSDSQSRSVRPVQQLAPSSNNSLESTPTGPNSAPQSVDGHHPTTTSTQSQPDTTLDRSSYPSAPALAPNARAQPLDTHPSPASIEPSTPRRAEAEPKSFPVDEATSSPPPDQPSIWRRAWNGTRRVLLL